MIPMSNLHKKAEEKITEEEIKNSKPSEDEEEENASDN